MATLYSDELRCVQYNHVRWKSVEAQAVTAGNGCTLGRRWPVVKDSVRFLNGRFLVNEQWRSRITIESGKRGGRPCIRGMRITVFDVLSYLAAGMTVAEILDDFPYLTAEDIQACLAFAAERERTMLVSVE